MNFFHSFSLTHWLWNGKRGRERETSSACVSKGERVRVSWHSLKDFFANSKYFVVRQVNDFDDKSKTVFFINIFVSFFEYFDCQIGNYGLQFFYSMGSLVLFLFLSHPLKRKLLIAILYCNLKKRFSQLGSFINDVT